MWNMMNNSGWENESEQNEAQFLGVEGARHENARTNIRSGNYAKICFESQTNFYWRYQPQFVKRSSAIAEAARDAL